MKFRVLRSVPNTVLWLSNLTYFTATQIESYAVGWLAWNSSLLHTALQKSEKYQIS
jgi:hypothetical protein